MIHGGRRVSSLLFIGDLAVFAASLWITLLLRYGELPGTEILMQHVGSFSILFAIWLFVFYLSGLYGKRIILSKTSLPTALLKTQVVNILIAAVVFFLLPDIGIAPKTNLVIYLGVSLMLIFPWRLALFPRLSRPSNREKALLVAEGTEAEALVREVNNNPRYHLEFVETIPPALLSQYLHSAAPGDLRVLVVDTEHAAVAPLLPALYDFCFSGQPRELVDFYAIYEDVFDRVPLSFLSHDWFLRNAVTPSVFYDVVKRSIDIVGGVLMGVITVIATPLVALALRLEGKGSVFIAQDRIGEHGVRIRTYKFRSMRYVDQGAWEGETKNYVTRVGSFLRLSSLDEFPQFVNILKGELSLIGPRNDIEGLAKRLAESLPYYMVRYTVRPGITGWAQINQQYEQGHISPQSIEETKTRLAYDFYYIKHRSLALDLVIALKTLKRMVFRISSW
ncbi:MAG: sugar transferase [Patescibacteria group bacterium]|mgnify:CR=1 FL=1